MGCSCAGFSPWALLAVSMWVADCGEVGISAQELPGRAGKYTVIQMLATSSLNSSFLFCKFNQQCCERAAGQLQKDSLPINSKTLQK